MNRKEETKAFREWLEAWLMPSEFSPGYLYKLDDDGEYAIDFVRTAWEAWEARALRASAAPEEGMKREESAAKIIHEARKVYENHQGDGAWLAMERAYFDLISAALAPATEGGEKITFSRWWIEQARDQMMAMKLPSGYVGDWIFLFREQLSDALAPSPSVGTPEMTSAQREDAAE